MEFILLALVLHSVLICWSNEIDDLKLVSGVETAMYYMIVIIYVTFSHSFPEELHVDIISV